MQKEAGEKNEVPKGELEAAKGTVSAFLNVLKTYALYSEYHPFCEEVVSRYHGNLLSFLEKYETLRLTVKRHLLLYEDREVHSGPANEDNIAFSLFRDGIEWIEMIEGIQLWETKAIVKIVHKYKRLPEEPEGDLVTAFWEAQLPHFDYEATEYIPEENIHGTNRSQTTFITGKSGSAERVDLTGSRSLKTLKVDSAAPANRLFEGTGALNGPSGAVELSTQEIEALHVLVDREEHLDPTQEILTMLLEIMHSQEDKNCFLLSLDFMRESFDEAFIAKDFSTALHILKTVSGIRAFALKERPWALTAIDDLVMALPQQEYFSLLEEALSDPACPHLEEIKELLMLLHPEAISRLAPMLVNVEREEMQAMITNVIITLASRDITPLERLLSGAPEDLLVTLIGILGKIPGEHPVRLITESIHHTSEIVRKVVLRTLIQRDVWDPEKLFSLIDDPSEYIRKTLITYLISRKCETTERLFMKYLAAAASSAGSERHLLACYKALGVCGSHRSLPMLREMLLGGNLFSKITGSVNRRGAAIALRERGGTDALQVLTEAAKSYYPGIRLAAPLPVTLHTDTV